MSRIRSIKPEFWSSEQVMECSPTARLLFIGIWNFCDDHGRFPLAPRQLKALIFAGDDISSASVRGMLDELSANGLLQFYERSGKEYFYVTGWQHQKIEKRGKPKYPDPLLPNHSPTDPRTVGDRKGCRKGGGNPSQEQEPGELASHTHTGEHLREAADWDGIDDDGVIHRLPLAGGRP